MTRAARVSLLLQLVGVCMATVVPPVPTDLACAAGTTSTSLECSFTTSAGATLYDVELSAKATAAPFTSFTTSYTTTVLSDLRPGTTYFARARAHASAANGGGREQMIVGWSNFSAAVAAKTSSAPLGARALDLRREGGLDPAGPGSIGVAWSWSAADAECVLRAGPAERGQLRVRAAARRATLTGLAQGRAFGVTLRCGAQALQVASEPLLLRTGSADSLWIEPMRVAENLITTPDYLSNHNSGTVSGDAAFLTGAGAGHFFVFGTSPRVKYCVEVVRLSLAGIPRTPSGPPEIPVNTNFSMYVSEYLSCNGNGSRGTDPIEQWGNYSCLCDNHIDRVIAHQTQQQLDSNCGPGGRHGPHGGTCNCSSGSVAWGKNTTGFMAISLPWDLSVMPRPLKTPLIPFGGWYSHPSGSKCEDDGSILGANPPGCTWRRDPRASMVYGADLLAAGWVQHNRSKGAVPVKSVEDNFAAMQKAFRALPETERCCGC